MLTQSRLKELFTYDPKTGLFTRNIYVPGQSSRVGTLTAKGYLAIGIDRKHYLAHRLAFLYMTGEWPKEHVDHKNEIKTDNSWENLRDCTRSENFKNVGARKNNKLGVKGVTKTKTGYLVMFCIGTYKTIEEAKTAYEKMALLYHGEFIHKSVRTSFADEDYCGQCGGPCLRRPRHGEGWS